MSSTSWINLDALWKIIVVGILLGAGLPALFSVGLRALGPATPEGEAAPAGGTVAGKAIAGLCFAVVLAGIAWGVYKIVHPS